MERAGLAGRVRRRLSGTDAEHEILAGEHPDDGARASDADGRPDLRTRLAQRWSSVVGRVGALGAEEVASREAEPAPLTETRWPLLLVGFAVAFNGWGLRSEFSAASLPNDGSVHSLVIAYAKERISAGHLPMNGWFPYLSLGSPFLMHYQSTPGILTGLLAEVIGVQHAYAWTLYLLLGLWPISVFLGGRLLGWDRWNAAIAAAAAPLVASVAGYGFGHQAYLWIGNGLWTQLWGMWLLPLAWGLTWQAVARRRHLFGAVLCCSAIIAFHFLTAYLAGLTLVLWAFLRPTELVRRLGRVLLVGGCAALATLWVTLPILTYARWSAANEFQVNTFWNNSYGWRQVLSWLVEGRLLDSGRLPVLTVFLAIGLVVSATRARRDERHRALLGAFLLSLVLYIGTSPFGFLIHLLPGHGDLLLHRYVMGVQLAGIYLAALGISEVGRAAVALAARSRAASTGIARRFAGRGWAIGLGGVLLVLALLVPGWYSIGGYDSDDAANISYQQGVDAASRPQLDALIRHAESLGGGRIYAGLPSNWGYDFRIGEVPVYIYLTQHAAPAIGFTLRTYSLMSGPEAYFDENVPGDYRLFGVRYLLLPVGHAPPVPATLLDQQGDFQLWSVGTRGLAQVVDTSGSLHADASDLGATMAPLLRSRSFGIGPLPGVAFGSAKAAASSLVPGESTKGPPGTVLDEHNELADGRATLRVRAKRSAVVVLDASFDPGWTVTVDGQRAPTQMVAPALVGVAVPPGEHTVVFAYVGYRHFTLLFVIGALTLALLALWTWRSRLPRPRRPAS